MAKPEVNNEAIVKGESSVEALAVVRARVSGTTARNFAALVEQTHTDYGQVLEMGMQAVLTMTNEQRKELYLKVLENRAKSAFS